MGFTSTTSICNIALADKAPSFLTVEQTVDQGHPEAPALQTQLSSIAESESVIDISALLIDRSDNSSPPPIAESDVSSVSTRNSNTSFSAFGRDSFYEDDVTVVQQQAVPLPERRPSFTGTLIRASNIIPKLRIPPREPLQWEFSGLTLWIELEEFDNDLTNAMEHMSSSYGTELIPQSHMTAIYGMEHLSVDEAIERLRSLPSKLKSGWPKFRRPIGFVQDVAVAGNPGQVCSIAWAQLTLASGPDHEVALDKLYDIFYGEDSKEKAERHRPWTPHNSFAYDNPKDTVLTSESAFGCIAKFPTLLSKERNVAAISLWDTNGRMGGWNCLGRVRFD